MIDKLPPDSARHFGFNSEMNFASKRVVRGRYHIGNDGDACFSEQCPCKELMGASSIFTASEQNDIGAVTRRIAADPSVVHKRDPFGYSPLHFAAQHNHTAVVTVLLEHGATVDACDCGATPLHRAAYAGSYECCELLLKAGSDPNRVDTSFMDNRTALHKAAASGHRRVMDLLLTHGADPTLKDHRNNAADGIYQSFMTKSRSILQESAEIEKTVVAQNTLDAESTSKVLGESEQVSQQESEGSAGFSCPLCGQVTLLFTRSARKGLMCLDCYSKLF